MKNKTIIVYALVFFIACALTSSVLQGRVDVASLLRAKRWDKLEQLFRQKSPQKSRDIYAKAMAILSNSSRKKQSLSRRMYAFGLLTKLLGVVECKNNKSELGLINCLSNIKSESQKRAIQRISSLRAAKLAEKHRMPELSQQFIIGASMRQDDLLSELIFQQRLGQLIRSKEYKAAYLLANRKGLKHISSPFSNLLRARSYAYNKGNKYEEKALYYYFKTAYKTQTAWIRTNLYKDMRTFFPQLFNRTKINDHKKYRSFTSLADKLKKSQLNIIHNSYTHSEVLQTSTRETLLMDGVYFIKRDEYPFLQKLFQKFYSHISKNHFILSYWNTKLNQKKQYKQSFWMLSSFIQIFPNDSDLWYAYIQLYDKLEKQDKKADKKRHWKQFQEIIKYLEHFPHHRRMQDLLLEKLLGSDNSKIQWASKQYWQLATKRMPHHTASGRFFYWLKRYYIHRNQKKELKKLKNEFYALAPGSFYAAELWRKKSHANFSRDWKKVKNHRGYLRWLSKYGGHERVTQFLRNKRRSHLENPKAKWIAAALEKTPPSLDATTRLFFELGDWEGGVRYFKDRYKNKLSQKRYLLQLTQLGRHTGHLNVQVYYLRRLLLSEKVSLDPFSLPKPLAKLLYPRVYYGYVRQYSKQYNINENISYALMHQESLFRENAISRSGARGLMQIMPRTGAWLIKMLFKKYRPNIDDPKTNIHLGIYYFSRLIRKNDNDFRWASIAYNGGPGNLRKWKSAYYNGDFYYFLERLPNNESRNYCRITYENYFRYKIIYGLSS